jgi:hypothetical protein
MTESIAIVTGFAQFLIFKYGERQKRANLSIKGSSTLC